MLISLIEAGESPTSKVVEKALTCLKADKDIDDPYSLAVRAYALAIAGSLDAIDTVNSLLNISKQTTDTLYWDTMKIKSKHFPLLIKFSKWKIKQ